MLNNVKNTGNISRNNLEKFGRKNGTYKRTLAHSIELTDFNIYGETKMLNIIWSLLMIISISYAIFTGNAEGIMENIIESADSAVKFALGLVGVVSLWCGIIKILEDAGAVRWFLKFLRPVIIRIFPSTKENGKAQKAIVTNITANFLGLGNGATPSGIEAVGELGKNVRDVCLFLVINSAGIQLIPSTVIAMRAGLGASAPADILLPTWIVSVVSMISAIAIFFLFNKLKRMIKK